MNKNLGYYIRDFLNNYLQLVRNFSQNTIMSYRDTIKLFLIFNRDINHLKIDNKDNILNFLNWLENKRNCSINTRNQRLACLKSFCKFIFENDSLSIEYLQNILIYHLKDMQKRKLSF